MKKWKILFFIVGMNLSRFIFRMKLISWLCKFMGNALQGCAEDPVPGDFLTRYTKRLSLCLRLYRLLMKHDKEKKRKD